MWRRSQINIHAEWSDHKWTALFTGGNTTKIFRSLRSHLQVIWATLWPRCFSFQKWEQQSVLCHIKEQPTELTTSVSGSMLLFKRKVHIFTCNKTSFTVLLYFDYCMQCNFCLLCSLLNDLLKYFFESHYLIINDLPAKFPLLFPLLFELTRCSLMHYCLLQVN